MSVIAGIYHSNNEPVPLEYCKGIMKVLKHYPADDIQIWHKENVFLGCHAQWITPESIREQLPYYDYDRQLTITADAIIDNRDELFEQLQVERSQRKTMPDSHLILLAYQKWEEETPKYLVGDFTFMIWDEKRKKFFGARDFSGARTLYFYHSQQHFAFCTITQPLFKLPYITNQLNEQWLAEFLAIPWNFESVDTDSTVYKDIQQIPPSHSISVYDGKVRLSRYSTLKAGQRLKLKTNEEYEEAFRDVFQSAVTARLRTHHQVGAHLSGGLDSGSVASFAANSLKRENKQLHTFSYIPVKHFVDWTPKSRVANEKPLIESTVQYVGNINDRYYDFEGRSPLTEVDDWLDVLEMPYKFFENTFWLKGIYEEAHKQGVRVLLNGQRGNWTVSWGHAIDYQAMLLKKLKLIRFYREVDLYSKNLGVKRSRVFSAVRKKAFPLLNQSAFSRNDSQFPLMINSEFAKKWNVFEKLKQHGIDLTGNSITNAYEVKKKQFEQLYYWNITGTYGSKLSLRYSVWDRDPTNDLRVIQFCLSVPEEQYVQDGIARSLIRRSTKNLLPDNIRLNQRTRGVQGADGIHRMIPSWGNFMKELQQLIADPNVTEFLNLKSIREAIEKLGDKPRPEHVYDLDFRLLMRSLIFYRFIKNFA
ncbi:lasso peptide isopeptide bond-forming cyclase [Priestia megaterium]|uniref:lasso peptide isopeptide bond-forming cyclase n=1 Tax=Priestia megaterium TaxID=1404 RepID=UPI00298C6B0E|nr:lasso peptide isopeptide bond-forming cyclase [Priestia megaterium]